MWMAGADITMDPIVIDDLPEQPDEIIDVDEDKNDDVVEVFKIKDYRVCGRYDDIILENKLFGEFIDKCLELENSDGMRRVLNRSLIPAYERTTKMFRLSDVFNCIITRALINLERAPHLKFSHVKDLCERIKFNNNRKKSQKPVFSVPSLNAIKNLELRKICRNIDAKDKIAEKKKPKERTSANEIVLSDDSDGFEVPIVNLEEYTNGTSENNSTNQCIENDSDDVCLVVDDEIPGVNDNVPSEVIDLDNEKENDTGNVKLLCETNSIRKNVMDLVISNVTSLSKKNVPKPVRRPSVEEVVTYDVDQCLVPHKSEQFLDNKEQIIEEIERDISYFKSQLEICENLEVTDDSIDSPYLKCDRYKSQICLLYEKLCKLTGKSAVKRREVRLKAANERSALPMKRLEEFINKNIGSDGRPHFPDFYDVVQCVREANTMGGLGWSNQEIMQEARALFTYCGRALQKSRQRREWRDVLALGRGRDPAEDDPALAQRLRDNRRRAAAAERDMMRRYTNMDHPEPAIDSDCCDYQPVSKVPRLAEERVRRVYIPAHRNNAPPINVIKENQTAQTLPGDLGSETNKDISGNNNLTFIATTQGHNVFPNTIQLISSNPGQATLPKVLLFSNMPFSPCSLTLLQGLANSANLSELQLINIASVNHSPSAIKGAESITSTMNITEIPNDKTQVSNDSGNCEVTSSDIAMEENSVNLDSDDSNTVTTTQMPETIESQEELNAEVVDIKNEGTNSDSSNENNVSTTGDPSISILEHLLKARVVLPKIPLSNGKINTTSITDNILAQKLVSSNSTNKSSQENENVMVEHGDRDKGVINSPLPTNDTDNNDSHINNQKVMIQNSEPYIRFKEEPWIGKDFDDEDDDSIKDIKTEPSPSSDISVHRDKQEEIIDNGEAEIKIKDEPCIEKQNCLDNIDSGSANDVDNQLKALNCVNGDSQNENTDDGKSVIKIKQEPCIDIQKELDELGDDFTTTIIDIEDPFLVVEISSDSDSEDEESSNDEDDL